MTLPGMGAQNAGQSPRIPLNDVVNALNMRSGLQYIFDAGDSASYPGVGQSITDRAGLSSIRRGPTLGVDGTDILWTGTAGANGPNEYFYGPGLLDFPFSGNAWIDTLHVNSALWAVAGWHYYQPNVTSGGGYLAGTAGTNADVGVIIGMAPNSAGAHANKLNVVISNATPSPGAATILSSGAVPANQWSFFAVVVDEAAGSFAMLVNGAVTTGSLTFVSPSAAVAANDFFFAPEGRIANSVMWRSNLPTTQQLLNLFNATRGRFGV